MNARNFRFVQVSYTLLLHQSVFWSIFSIIGIIVLVSFLGITFAYPLAGVVEVSTIVNTQVWFLIPCPRCAFIFVIQLHFIYLDNNIWATKFYWISEHTAIACAIYRFKGHWDFTIRTRLLFQNNTVLKQLLVHFQNIKHDNYRSIFKSIRNY